MYATGKANSLGSPDLVIDIPDTASNTGIIATDFNLANWAGTQVGRVTYANYTTGGYETITISTTAVVDNGITLCRLDHIGSNTGESVLKASPVSNDFIVRQSGILDSPEENTSYTFQFATNIPCPGTPTVEYEGQAYNTIQIFSQCWLKENLNVGTMVMGTQNQADNGIIEKYCYNNKTENCDIYGGLYLWYEMMNYSTVQNTQGVCPTGWHLPSDSDWNILTNTLGGGEIAGGKLKEAGTSHWTAPNTGATNESGKRAGL